MRTRKLGRQGPRLSVLGVGSWAMGGPYSWGWGPQDDDDSVAAIRAAVEAGINWVDTAPAYGSGHSESVVGRALDGSIGEGVYVFTKCGLDPSRQDEHGRLVRDLRPATIRRECEQSLRRLRRNHIDLYQFHWPDHTTGTAIEDSWSTMLELVAEGKVRWAGVSNFDTSLLERCEGIGHVDSLQPRLNLLDRAPLEDEIPWCGSRGTGVLAYSPLASGLLTGKYDRDSIEDLPPDDWRRRSPDFTEPRVGRNLEVVERLKSVARDVGVPVPAVAVAWVLGVRGVTGAIVGLRRPSHLGSILPAAERQISPAALERLDRALANHP